MYPLLASVHYSFSYISTCIKYYFLHLLHFMNYVLHITSITIKVKCKTQEIDSLLGCWAWFSNNSLKVKIGWVIFEVLAWVSCLSFQNHFLGNLDWPWEFPVTTIFCSLPRCIYFSVFFGRPLHEKIYCL